MKKKLFAVATSSAMITSMVLFGSAFAKDRVEVKVTSEPIQSRSTCDKAGGFSLEFDSESTLRDGDRITIDTDYISAANFTSLCRNIDLLIAPVGSALGVRGATEPFVWGAALGTNPIPLSGAPNAGPVYHEIAAPTVLNGGANFHVYGSQGSQRITFDVIGADADAGDSVIEIPNTPGSKLVVKFLDQTTPYFWTNVTKETPTDLSIYETPATLADNTLCLNVSQWDNATVNANMDSSLDKFTFIPSNPQIAHIVAASTYTAEACKGANCGNILIGKDIVQGKSTCSSFNDETGAPPYCQDVDQHENNSLIIQRAGNVPFDATNYELTLEVLVNGVAGDNGVYFAGPPVVGSSATEDGACALTAFDQAGASTYYLPDGETTPFEDLGNNDCAVPDEARAIKVVTAANSLGLNGTNEDFLRVNMPEMVYDASEVSPNDEVTVRVTLTRAPCGTVITTDHCVGTMVSACSTIARSRSVNFPYFTEGNTDGFWDGIAITNTTTTDGTVTLTMYEADGDVATATVSVPATGMYVNTLETMIADAVFAITTSVDGTLGNARSQIVASSDTIDIDGFAMMGNNATGVSMGYLPRKAGLE